MEIASSCFLLRHINHSDRNDIKKTHKSKCEKSGLSRILYSVLTLFFLSCVVSNCAIKSNHSCQLGFGFPQFYFYYISTTTTQCMHKLYMCKNYAMPLICRYRTMCATDIASMHLIDEWQTHF